MRAIVLIIAGVAAAALAACATTPPAPGGSAQAAPKPADGLWAMLDPGCGKPRLADPRRWPQCAQPFWISAGEAVVVRSTPPGGEGLRQTSYRAQYRLAAGDPLIVRVGNTRDGYLFLALTGLGRDPSGRLVAAVGAAFGCDGAGGQGVVIAPNRGGCEGRSSDEVHRAASLALKDSQALTRVTWIAAGAPEATTSAD